MEVLWQDLRYGFRMLMKSPSFTFIAILTLALGIGANTAIFSVVNGILLRPLAFQNPQQLMVIYENNAQRNVKRAGVAPANYLAWKAQNKSFSDIAISTGAILNYTGNQGAERLDGAQVSANTFAMLGEKPILGRGFLPEEEQPGHDNVVILTEPVWERMFGADRDIIGRTIQIDSQPVTVVGIVSHTFHYPFSNTLIYKPLALSAALQQNHMFHMLYAVARLRSGVSVKQAQAEMETIARQLAQAYPQSNDGWGTNLVSLHEDTIQGSQQSLYILLGAVFFVLLIACVNVASLLSARMAARQKEIGLRTALGASRYRVIRQLLTESVLLSLLGGVAGVLLGVWGLKTLLHTIPTNALPRIDEIGLDPTVLGFTVLLSIGTGLMFGLAPAWQTTHSDLNSVLKESGRSSTSTKSQHRFRHLLVITEVVLSLVLLISSGLLLRSFIALRNVDPGFRQEGVLVNSQLVLPRSKYDGKQGQLFFKTLIERVQNIPGVQAVGGITALPLQRNSGNSFYSIAGRPPQPKGQELTAVVNIVTPDYFKTLTIPLKRGRFFTERDNAGAAKSVLINETLAKQQFPNQDPLSQQIYFPGDTSPYQVAGVVGDVKQFGLDNPTSPEIFTSFLQTPVTFMYVMVKTSGDPLILAKAVKGEVQKLDPDQPVGNRTLAQQFDNAIAQPRFYSLLLGLFAGVALILAAVGIYGVMSYSVTQRVHEFGIRLALGAQAGDVIRLVVGQGLVLAAIGIVIGLVASIGVTRFLTTLLFNVTTTDPVTFAGISILLAVIALLACFIPALRATKVDPMIALRTD